ncbi:MAG: HPr kinase/phosphatase C-terminal domain-containing protein [Pseudomonadota bacterium]
MPPDMVAPPLAPAPTAVPTAGRAVEGKWLHATCVEFCGAGVALLGASGCGKSDLALRLIDAGATLVADDQLWVELSAEGLISRAADRLAGLLEVRGLGIVRLPHRRDAPLKLVVKLTTADQVDRLPQPSTYRLLETELRCLLLDPWEASAVAKIRVALTAEQVV